MMTSQTWFTRNLLLRAVSLADHNNRPRRLGKVEICHFPPGNKSEFKTLSVGQDVVAGHLEHGDLLGSCEDNCLHICFGEEDAPDCVQRCRPHGPSSGVVLVASGSTRNLQIVSHSDSPTGSPSDSASEAPSGSPSDKPSDSRSDSPSGSPTDSPSDSPSGSPSNSPSGSPSDLLSDSPSDNPSDSPSDSLSDGPSDSPSASPSAAPSSAPCILLCIYSNVAEDVLVGGETPPIDAGHAALMLIESSDAVLTVTTYGLWPDDHDAVPDNGDGSDIRVSFPLDAWSPQRYPYIYCERLDDAKVQKLKTEVAKVVTWACTHNCASFASETFFTVTGTDVDADELLGLETPREIGQNIRVKNGGNNQPPPDADPCMPSTSSGPPYDPDSSSHSSFFGSSCSLSLTPTSGPTSGLAGISGNFIVNGIATSSVKRGTWTDKKEKKSVTSTKKEEDKQREDSKAFDGRNSMRGDYTLVFKDDGTLDATKSQIIFTTLCYSKNGRMKKNEFSRFPAFSISEAVYEATVSGIRVESFKIDGYHWLVDKWNFVNQKFTGIVDFKGGKSSTTMTYQRAHKGFWVTILIEGAIENQSKCKEWIAEDKKKKEKEEK